MQKVSLGHTMARRNAGVLNCTCGKLTADETIKGHEASEHNEERSVENLLSPMMITEKNQGVEDSIHYPM